MMTQAKPRVLCVDDEPLVLESMILPLLKRYDFATALSGAEALELLNSNGGAVDVVVSDMRMPGMDGVALLRRVMQQYPDCTRILLTGDGARDTAVLGINHSRIFRYLTKPCPSQEFESALQAGVMQHRLVQAERAVLQETLLGCIKALIDVLALANPVAFGRASRVKRLTMELAARIGCGSAWQLEAAAMLSQLGYVSLPVELVEKMYYGETLTPEEKVIASGVPEVATKLLGRVPRLEPVMQILMAVSAPDRKAATVQDELVATSARILGLVLEYDSLIAQGQSVPSTIEALRGRQWRYGAQLVDIFARHLGEGSARNELRRMPVRCVKAGMTVLQDLRTHLGTVVLPKGAEVTDTFIQRIPVFGPELMAEEVDVLVPGSAALRSRPTGT